ncbi:hypothetical protein LTR97_006931 [Elasticomyces elasticus]|uniref:L domain-like protein n=1 Tax=Elasticomyces elasticus TaxID=574655 RepID=A0AAN7W773_9PEZI|nr:hypothetical protein LTR97_006931 [Elasticomyces elasticus]
MDSHPPKKPSGIPRLSRLPVLRTKSSQVFTTTTTQYQPPDIPDNYRPAAATPKLQKRASAASLLKAQAQAQTKDLAASTTTRPRPALPAGTKSYDRPSTGTLRRPSSRGNQQRTQLVAKRAPQTDDEENQDHLTSLNGFRAASRQGSYDDSSPIDYPSPSPLDEDRTELFRPRDRNKPRPSLSERTMESLQTLPSTPSAKDRRRSSFFAPVESPMGPPPPRPGSSLSRNGSSRGSRPGTSDGSFTKSNRPASPAKTRAPASAKPASKVNGTGLGFGFAPASANGKRRSVSTALTLNGGGMGPPMRSASPSKRPTINGSLDGGRSPSPAKRPAPMTNGSVGGRSPSPAKRPVAPTTTNGTSSRSSAKPLVGSKTLSARPSKPRAGLGDLFGSQLNGAAPPSVKVGGGERKAKPSGTPAKRVASNPTSSTALREQIAAAKAAARKEKAKMDSPQQADRGQFETFEGLSGSSDPFNLAPKDPKHVLRNRIKTAWTDGKLNIAGLALKDIPDEVLGMFDAKAMESAGVNWAEVVDLTKLLAADNELEELGENVFPDRAAETWAEGDGGEGMVSSPFGGLEVMDLHGNRLGGLPMGMRRMERLTKLDLSHNKLENGCLEIVAEIASLKELKLGHNNLSGNFPSSVCGGLKGLEVLDLKENRLLSLPDAMRELVGLRVLDVGGNQVTALPMEALQMLPLLEMDASNNALIGSLFPLGGVSGHETLQVLNIANNSLAALTFSGEVGFPRLKVLDVTNNHFTGLPDMGGWVELATLTAGDNKITEVPEGFTGLRKLRTVNFTSNELRLLDSEMARMESLEVLILAANPMREKKYLSMTAADIKKDLGSKLEPEDDEVSEPETVIGPTGSHLGASMWAVQGNGVLDLASLKLSDDVNDRLGSTLRTEEVRELRLQLNALTSVPPALWLGQDLRILDLSNNPFGSEDYFSAELELPVLQELNLSHCRLATLEPLMSQLTAPALRTINLTANKLSGAVPGLRETYPALTTLHARDNRFESVTANALRSFVTVDLGGNSLQGLPAELGLLWDEGLRHLDVSGNAFRVPNYQVLGKGTEAVCRWLKGRIVDGEGGRCCSSRYLENSNEHTTSISKMCLFVIKHWEPCLHMRGRCVDQCNTNLATPGVMADDCAERREAYLDDPESGACPICQRREASAEHIAAARQTIRSPTASLRRPTSVRSPSTAGSTVTGISMCEIGRCDFHDIAANGLQCGLCDRAIGRTDDESVAGTVERDFYDSPLSEGTVVSSIHEGSGEDEVYQRWLSEQETVSRTTTRTANTPVSPDYSTPGTTSTAAAWQVREEVLKEGRVHDLSRNF